VPLVVGDTIAIDHDAPEGGVVRGHIAGPTAGGQQTAHTGEQGEILQ
jgi:hypothetical protein